MKKPFQNLILQSSDLRKLDCAECSQPINVAFSERVSERFQLETFVCLSCNLQEAFVVEYDPAKDTLPHVQ